MNIHGERQLFLEEELKEYEKTTPMTEEEQQMDAITNAVKKKSGKQFLPSQICCDQRKLIGELYRRYMLCWEVIVMNDLRDEASEYIGDHLFDSIPFDVVTDWF